MQAAQYFVLTLLLTVLGAACATLPREHLELATGAPAILTSYHLKAEPHCYLDFLPLPATYPPGYSRAERVFTGEVFAREPGAPLDSQGLLFVPRDHQAILESTFLYTFRSLGIVLRKYPTIHEAESAGCRMLIWGAPVGLHVEDESRAVVQILYTVFRFPGTALIWQGTVEAEHTRHDLPRSLTGDDLVFLIGNHRFNFQPQRALLAVAIYMSTFKLLSDIEASGARGS